MSVGARLVQRAALPVLLIRMDGRALTLQAEPAGPIFSHKPSRSERLNGALGRRSVRRMKRSVIVLFPTASDLDSGGCYR